MKFGLASVNLFAFTQPPAFRRLLLAAEGCGFESIWVGDHVVLPRQGASPPPGYAPQHIHAEMPVLDPVIALAFAAACTTRLRLATGLVVLPLRNPVVLSKQLASVDALSGGRLIFGYGVGYVAAEWRAAGVPGADRGRRADEYLDAMLALWSEPSRDFVGQHVRLEGVDAWPKPMRGRPPIVVGGHSHAALRRAARRADGWYGWRLDVDEAAHLIAALRDAERHHRVADRPLEVTVTPKGGLDPGTVKRFAALGVDRLVPLMPEAGRDVDKALAFVAAHATVGAGSATPSSASGRVEA